MTRSDFRPLLRAVALAGWALQCASGSAWAAPGLPRLVVVPFTSAEGIPERVPKGFMALTADELRTRDDKVVVVPSPALKPSGPARPAPARKGAVEGGALLAEGRKALADLRFEEAAAAFKKGVELTLQDPGTADYPAVFEALVGSAVAHFRLGDEKSAQASLFTLARLNPGFKLADDKYPPVFARELEKAKKRVEKAQTGTVVIEGPPGSTAFLNGRDLGMVPVTEENQPNGLHYVKVEGTRGERFGQTVELKGGTVRVKGAFAGAAEHSDGAFDPRVSSTIDADTLARLTAYTQAAGADYALLAVLTRNGERSVNVSPALFSLGQRGVIALVPASIQGDLAQSNQVAFALADEVLKRAAAFGAPATLPLVLSLRSTSLAVSAYVNVVWS